MKPEVLPIENSIYCSRNYMKLQIDEDMWNGFDFYFFI